MRRLLFTGLLSIAFAACTATGDVEDDGPVSSINNGGNASPGSHHGDSSSSASVSGDSAKAYLSDYIGMVDVLAASLTRDNAEFLVSEFSIAKHEVDQGLYRRIMGDIPKTDALGDNYPVFNVSWFDAALFCNALSKRVFLDTAYVYSSVDASGSLVNLSINYSVAAVRLPTEMEWEIAARAGTSTTYFWDTDVAYKYAYYAQSNGPAMVATYMPNSLGLYDMAGNVAEWVNDWFAAYPAIPEKNYGGPAEGSLKVVRGGGWNDKVTALASSERDKQDPKSRAQTLGFRIVYSKGF